jgi:hypothetical protein
VAFMSCGWRDLYNFRNSIASFSILVFAFSLFGESRL